MHFLILKAGRSLPVFPMKGYCHALKKIDLSNTLTSLGTDLFYGDADTIEVDVQYTMEEAAAWGARTLPGSWCYSLVAADKVKYGVAPE